MTNIVGWRIWTLTLFLHSCIISLDYPIVDVLAGYCTNQYTSQFLLIKIFPKLKDLWFHNLIKNNINILPIYFGSVGFFYSISFHIWGKSNFCVLFTIDTSTCGSKVGELIQSYAELGYFFKKFLVNTPPINTHPDLKKF